MSATSPPISSKGRYTGSPGADSRPGVRLSGVRQGSPAEQAGLRAAAVLLRIGTYEIADLQAMPTRSGATGPGTR